MDSEKYEENQIDSSKKLFNVITNNEIIVLKFSASWCGPCQNKKFKKEYNETKKKLSNVKFVELDVDDDDSIINDKTYYNITVNSVPYFLLGYNNNFVKEYFGTNSLNNIKEDIEILLNNKN